VRFPAGAGNFSLHHLVQNGSGAHPPSYPMSTRGPFLRGKAAGHEADHSPPSSAEVKNAWIYTSTPQYVFMAWCSVKHRDNFTFYCNVYWCDNPSDEQRQGTTSVFIAVITSNVSIGHAVFVPVAVALRNGGGGAVCPNI
jgi:hypothetical protein